jgi:hypothetical protein
MSKLSSGNVYDKPVAPATSAPGEIASNNIIFVGRLGSKDIPERREARSAGELLPKLGLETEATLMVPRPPEAGALAEQEARTLQMQYCAEGVDIREELSEAGIVWRATDAGYAGEDEVSRRPLLALRQRAAVAQKLWDLERSLVARHGHAFAERGTRAAVLEALRTVESRLTAIEDSLSNSEV